MPYIQNADANNYYNLTGIAYIAPGAVIWISQTLYDNSAVIAAALVAGEIIDYSGAGAPQPDAIPYQFETEFQMPIRSGATATSLQLQFLESLGGFEDSDGNLYAAGDTFITFRAELVDTNGNYLLWEGLRGEDPGDGSVCLTLTNDDKFKSGQSYPDTLGAGVGEYDLTDATVDNFVVTAEVSGGGGAYQQVVTVAKSGGDFTTIQDAVDSITDAAVNKRYLVLVYSGVYAEDITMKQYVYLCGMSRDGCIIQTSSAVELVSVYSNSGIENLTCIKAGNNGVPTVFVSSEFGPAFVRNCILSPTDPDSYAILSAIGDVEIDNCTITGRSIRAYNDDGEFNIEIKNCTIEVTVGYGIDLEIGNGGIPSSTVKIFDTEIINNYNNAIGHGIACIGAGTADVFLRDVKIECLHASANSIYADNARQVYVSNLNANREKHDNVTLISDVMGIDVPKANVITVAKSGGMFTTIQASIDSANPIVHSGTAQAGAADTITLAAAASAVDDYYNGMKVRLTGGTGSGQIRTIIDYVGSTKVATVDSNWSVNPDATTTYAVESIITVSVYPGEYDEAITLKDCVDIIAVDPRSTKILQAVIDNNVSCLCFLRIGLQSTLTLQNANSKVNLDENVLSMVKIGTATALVGGDVSGNARGGFAIDIQSSRSTASQVASGPLGVSVGINNTASGAYSITIGVGSSASGARSSASGYQNNASGAKSTASGYSNNASGANSTASGYYSTASGEGCTAIGYKARARIARTTSICGPQINRKDNNEAAGVAFESFCGVEVVLMTKEVDLKVVAGHTITLPAGCHFWIDAMGLEATVVTGMTVQPTVSYGITGNTTKHGAAAITTALTAAFKREIETPLVPEDGETSLVGAITVAATATTMLGRFYFKGMLIEDE